MRIKVKGLKCEYLNGENKQVLFSDKNLEINQGDFVVITGSSGSGKSSLLKILSGLQKPNMGCVYWDEENIYDLKNELLSNIKLNKSGFIYQDYMLIDELNVYDNIVLIQHLAKNVNKEKVNEVIETLKLENLLKKYPKVLSGGEKQKVSIARALVNNPEVIFCDEPTGSLDFKSTKEIMDLLAELNNKYNITIVLVTHELENLVYGKKFIKFENGDFKCE